MSKNREPNLMRLYIMHCAIGFVISALFVGLVLWFDIAQLGSLVAGSEDGRMAVFLLWFFNGTIFGSVQFAWRIMMKADDDNDRRSGGLLMPVRVAAPPSNRRKL